MELFALLGIGLLVYLASRSSSAPAGGSDSGGGGSGGGAPAPGYTKTVATSGASTSWPSGWPTLPTELTIDPTEVIDIPVPGVPSEGGPIEVPDDVALPEGFPTEWPAWPSLPVPPPGDPTGASTTTTTDPKMPCWKGFKPSGDPDADLEALAGKCAAGMTMVGAPAHMTFTQGETKTAPVTLPPGSYRFIAIGGKGVTDVDMMLKDIKGTIVTADLTPDDAAPVMPTTKEFVVTETTIYTLSVVVKKGAGDVVAAAWRR